MKLTEIKSNTCHYFRDEQGRLQGEYKNWYWDGQQWVICHFRDGKLHGEFKYWASDGRLTSHSFDMNDKEIINFLKTPELYPTTPEEKTMFVLKYGNAPFISEGEVE